MSTLKKDRSLNADAFRRLLGWLDGGVDSQGESYLETHGRLTRYFDRRNCRLADELADETLSRVASKLEEKGEIVGVSPAQYCYITAKFVFLESLRSTDRHHVGLQEAHCGDANKPDSPMSSNSASESLDNEKRMECLERCLGKLTPANRELILEYHRSKGSEKIERRAGLAERLGLTVNALSIRACRIRGKLEACVTACSKGA